jgi:hypothetical protein
MSDDDKTSKRTRGTRAEFFLALKTFPVSLRVLFMVLSVRFR